MKERVSVVGLMAHSHRFWWWSNNHISWVSGL